MEFAIWAYPWDIRDIGIEATIERLQTAGIDEVNLATNYHAVHSYSPTNPERRSYFAQASAYFQPSAEYGRLEPVPAPTMDGDDWVGAITAALANTSISVTAWTVGCHNSRLGLSNPDLTLRSPHGDPLAFGLCPSKPAVREYLTTMVSDLVDQYEVDRIEPETFDFFFGSGLTWHHDKVFVELGKLGNFLLGLCFCEDCRKRAKDVGVDVATARQTCIDTLDAIASGSLPSSIDPLQWISAHPIVHEYTAVRERTLENLFAELDDIVSGDLGYTIGMLDAGDEWLFGLDLDSLSSHVDYYTTLAYESSQEEVTQSVNTADALTPDVPVHVGLQPGPPVVDDGETVEEIVDAAIGAGTERVSFYNFGQLPERSFRWIRQATNQYV